MLNLVQDLRLGARYLARSPGFALTAIVVLALGIAPNVVIVSVANALLIKPLASADPGGLVGVYARDRRAPSSPPTTSPRWVHRWRSVVLSVRPMRRWGSRRW
jgi:hypothetical protein